MNLKILWLTSINPQKINKGTPSGLPWEVIMELKKDNVVDVRVISKGGDNRVLSKINQLGIFFRKFDESLEQYDVIFVYPNIIANYIPSKYKNKVISLGPDSSSLLFFRLYKNNCGLNAIKYKIYEKWFLYHEKRWINSLRKVVVVGEKDRENLIRINNKGNKIFYLHHPLLHNDLLSLEENRYNSHGERRRIMKRFVFSGDLSRFYIGCYIDKLGKLLRGKSLNILVVGVRNRWVYEKFKETNELARYIDWVDNYADVCKLESDVHCIPLMAGAGTKNRVMTAIANGLEVVTTPVGIENIDVKNMAGIYVAKTSEEFASIMISLNSERCTDEKLEKRISERILFRKTIDNYFSNDLRRLLE